MNTKKLIIPTKKGNISAVLNLSSEDSNKLAVLCPGYLDSKDYQHLQMLAEELCKLQFNVIRFDPIGTWESDGHINDYTMSQYLVDIDNVLKFAKAKFRKANQLLLGGHSRGGQMSLLYAAVNNSINIVIGIMPSSGPITGVRREEWRSQGFSISNRDVPGIGERNRVYKVPFTHVLDRDQYDLESNMHLIKGAKILLSGQLDELVTPESVKTLHKLASPPKSYISVNNIGHDYRFNEDEINLVNEKLVTEVQKYL